MKKILFALMALFCVSNLSAATNSTSSQDEGRRWTVTITVEMSVEYYSDRYKGGFLGGQSKGNIEQKVSVYAATKDEAETMGKQKCFQMCSDSNGEYQGTVTYKGQTAHMWLYRRILYARAE